MQAMKQYFHWCCKGLQHDLIFSSVPEFIAGMNRIAICAVYCRNNGRDVKVVAFCLLNNHFHFVLYGSEEDTSFFMDHFRLLTGKWLTVHRGERLHEKMELGHWAATNPEKVRDKVIYTLRQSYEAGHPFSPQGYRWCSARFMFADNSPILCPAKELGSLSFRTVRKITFSELELPPDWLLLPDGVIWPGSYMDLEACERLFSGPKDFMFCLNNGNIDRAVNVEMLTLAPSIPDNEVKDKADAMARDLFGKKNVNTCQADERLAIARYLRKQLHCGSRQLARVVRMEEDIIRKLA